MENPFSIDWEQEKERLLKRDYVTISKFLGVALLLILSAYFITSHFDDKDIVLTGVFVYMASFVAGIFALIIYKDTRDFGKEWYHPATSEGYERLLELSREYPITGAQCRAAVVDLLSRQGHITGWQVDLFTRDLKEVGDKERVEALKKAFIRQSLENGRHIENELNQ